MPQPTQSAPPATESAPADDAPTDYTGATNGFAAVLACFIGSAGVGAAGMAGLAFNAGDDIAALFFAALALAALVFATAVHQ